MKLFSHRKRAVHLGPYPLERLPRLAKPTAEPHGLGREVPLRPVESSRGGPFGCGHAYKLYVDLFDAQVDGSVDPRDQIPDDPEVVADNLKAGLYFLDADKVG